MMKFIYGDRVKPKQKIWNKFLINKLNGKFKNLGIDNKVETKDWEPPIFIILDHGTIREFEKFPGIGWIDEYLELDEEYLDKLGSL